MRLWKPLPTEPGGIPTVSAVVKIGFVLHLLSGCMTDRSVRSPLMLLGLHCPKTPLPKNNPKKLLVGGK